MAFKHVIVSLLLPVRCKLGVININNFKICDHICLVMLHSYSHCESTIKGAASCKPVANFNHLHGLKGKFQG